MAVAIELQLPQLSIQHRPCGSSQNVQRIGYFQIHWVKIQCLHFTLRFWREWHDTYKEQTDERSSVNTEQRNEELGRGEKDLCCACHYSGP